MIPNIKADTTHRSNIKDIFYRKDRERLLVQSRTNVKLTKLGTRKSHDNRSRRFLKNVWP